MFQSLFILPYMSDLHPCLVVDHCVVRVSEITEFGVRDTLYGAPHSLNWYEDRKCSCIEFPGSGSGGDFSQEMRLKEVKIKFTAYFLYLFAMNAVNRCEFFFSQRSPYSYKKDTFIHGLEPFLSCMSSNSYSTAPTVIYFKDISCEFK